MRRLTFDKVSHRKLICACAALGICDPLLSLIRDFLSFRTQRVQIEDALSEPQPVKSSILQGGCTSSIYWLIFFNSLALKLDKINGIKSLFYCDDVKIVSSVSSKIQLALNCVSEWTSEWQMVLSPEKCIVLPIGPGLRCTYFVNNVAIPISHERCQRDLGILITSNLSFATHTTHIVNKASGVASSIRRIFTRPSHEILCRAFTVYVRPILESSTAAFNSFLSADDINRIEMVQRKFTNFIFRRCHIPGRSYGYEFRCEFLGLESLAHRRHLADLSYLHRVFSRTQYCPDLFQVKNNARFLSHNSRITVDFKCKGALSKLWPKHIVADWNSIPESVILGKHQQFTEFIKRL